jgi:hypothetical protein
MKTLSEISIIFADYISEVGNNEELRDYIRQMGSVENASYFLWDDVFYGILNEEEISLFLNSIY